MRSLKSDCSFSLPRFKKLDTDQSGTVSLKELLELPELKQNPLTRRIMGILLIFGGAHHHVLLLRGV